MTSIKGFQSAPPVETRGDNKPRPVRGGLVCFNPLPPSKRGETAWAVSSPAIVSGFNPLPPSKRGETYPRGSRRLDVLVSIRSPRRNEGRLSEASRRLMRRCFNPLPPSKRGETHRGLLALPVVAGFNPLPPSKRGETRSRRNFRAVVIVSIRSPRRNEGRLVELGLGGESALVSIRSPRRNEGRPIQSAHFVEPSLVSIRSPRRNEGRHQLDAYVGGHK